MDGFLRIETVPLPKSQCQDVELVDKFLKVTIIGKHPETTEAEKSPGLVRTKLYSPCKKQ